MKFKCPYDKTPKHVGEIVASAVGVLDLYSGGAVEHLEERVTNLTRLVCVMVELLPPEQQIALLAHIAPSYQPFEEEAA